MQSYDLHKSTTTSTMCLNVMYKHFINWISVVTIKSPQDSTNVLKTPMHTDTSMRCNQISQLQLHKIRASVSPEFCSHFLKQSYESCMKASLVTSTNWFATSLATCLHKCILVPSQNTPSLHTSKSYKSQTLPCSQLGCHPPLHLCLLGCLRTNAQSSCPSFVKSSHCQKFNFAQSLPSTWLSEQLR